MLFRECSINGIKYQEINGKLIPEGMTDDSPDRSVPPLVNTIKTSHIAQVTCDSIYPFTVCPFMKYTVYVCISTHVLYLCSLTVLMALDRQWFDDSRYCTHVCLFVSLSVTSQSREELLFLKAVSLCHTVQISYEQPGDGLGDPFSHANGFSSQMEYYASSPDEKALVEATKRYPGG